MSEMRALDLFCGAGGASMGLHRAGFSEIVGVDINTQKRYPFTFIQADALAFPIEGFDFVWASPPCQKWTRLRHLYPDREYPNLIPETRERLVESGLPWVIENVEGAPLRDVGHLIMLCGTMFGLTTQDGRGELWRHRTFETSFSIALRPQCQHSSRSPLSVCGKGGHLSTRYALSVTGSSASGKTRPKVMTVCGHTPVDNTGRKYRRAVSVTGSTAQINVERNKVREVFSVEQAREVMGIDWMVMKELSQAVPPPYSEFIAKGFFSQMEGGR